RKCNQINVGFSPCAILLGLFTWKQAFFRSLFSRAVSAIKSAWALAPAVCFSGFSPENMPFPATSEVVPFQNSTFTRGC
ncbi:MAG TPA: hypothetical protein VN776_06040, partial [Terracidiphilus sp.]|nr:hypothetical protein [Terracidiphilus sp.]